MLLFGQWHGVRLSVPRYAAHRLHILRSCLVHPLPLALADYGNTETEGIPPVDDMAQLLKDALDQRLSGGRSPLQARLPVDAPWKRVGPHGCLLLCRVMNHTFCLVLS